MDIDPEIPRLVPALSLAVAESLESAWPTMREAGADALLLTTGNVAPATVAEPLKRIVTAAGDVPVLLAGAPSVAGGAGSGLVLPENGMAAAEARRQLRAGALLGREISSVHGAALAIGVDFIAGDWGGLAGGADSSREAIEASPVPMLWRVADADVARTAVAAGAEGVILEWGADPAAMAGVLRATSGLFPARTNPQRFVVVDGVPAPLLPDTAVTDLLADLGMAPHAIRRNGVAVPRRAWDDTLLAPGDVLETTG